MSAEISHGRAVRVLRTATKYGFAAGSTLYLWTLGLRRPRDRALITSIAQHFGYVDRRTETIPAVDLSDVVPDGVAIQLREPVGIDGNVSLLELVCLSKLARHLGPPRVFEIGTFDGRTTLNLAANAGEHVSVYTLDLPAANVDGTGLAIEASERVFVEKQAPGNRYRGTDVEARITQLLGDSATFDFGPYRGSIDLVFVDGSHAYDYVRNDTEVALGLLRPSGGVVLWHDYGVWDGVTAALNELHRARPELGLRRIRGTSLVLLDTRGRV